MLDTKLKNTKKIRNIIIITVLLAAAIVNVTYFSVASDLAKEKYNAEMEEAQEINMDILRSLYHGALVMYYEQTLKNSEAVIEPYNVFVKEDVLSEEQKIQLEEWFGEIYGNMESSFEEYRYQVDYYATSGTIAESNAPSDLAALLSENSSVRGLEELILYYRNLWILSFDENGQLQVKVITSEDVSADMLIKGVKRAESNYKISNYIQSYIEIENAAAAVNKIQNFTVIYGISEESALNLMRTDEWYSSNGLLFQYIRDTAGPAFFITVMILLIFAGIMNSPKIWKNSQFEEKVKYPVFELGVVGICMLGAWFELYCKAVYRITDRGLKSILTYVGLFDFWGLLRYMDIFVITLLVIVVLYAAAESFCPILRIGFKEYMKQYSILHRLIPQMQSLWYKFKKEIKETNLEENTTKTILKIVVINFIVLAVFCCMWVIGIAALIIYSLLLFYLLSEYVHKVTMDYEKLRKATKQIAEGELNTVITENIGIFEPIKEDLTQIQTGFKKAVDEEVKSQRMKAELITNVSHDLKTPLTAITTYVELLKKENITEEERKEYVSTLERKAMRLKVLIEDLFEVSKASSHSLTLNLMRVDIVKLMKQVVVEHKEKYDEAGLNLHWNVLGEKVELFLDNQKTYRIFENLFLNIQKYAMPNSRVYISVSDEEEQVSIIIKNMSAMPLNITGEELTERFVRGDASRNSEGSGLGLAIVKNFTEAQGGSFEVVVDGDLFKTTLIWKKCNCS